jgi:hypothetical protein
MRHLSAPSWVIYLLRNEQGEPCYVGATRDLARRMREHKKERGFRPAVEILEEGSGRWVEAEVRWIEHYRAEGWPLDNRVRGGNGCYTHSRATRALLSALGRGRPKPPGHGAKLSAITRGVPHNWAPGARARSAETQFKPGQHPSAKNQAAKVAGCKRWWSDIPAEERSRMATERNQRAWAKRTPEQRAEIGQKIKASNAKTRAARLALESAT